MKKKIILGFAVTAIVTIVAFNVNMEVDKNHNIESLSIKNVEALACEEGKSCGYPNHGPTADRVFSNTLYCKNENQTGCSY